MKLIIILTILLVMFPFPDAGNTNCDTGIWKRHDNFKSVFSYFPERIDFTVDGYVASVSCNNIGRNGTLFLGYDNYNISVADCLNRNNKPSPAYLGDIDYRLWYHSRVPNAPVKATICWSN